MMNVVLAQETMHLVVLEFASVGAVDEALLLQLSDQTRGAALSVFPKSTSNVQVLSRESLLDYVQRQGKDASCLDGECAVEVAKNINARFVVTGNVTYQQGTYRVVLKAHDSTSNRLLGQKNISASSSSELLTVLSKDSLLLIEDAIGPFDPGRKGVKDIWVPGFEVARTPYRILNLSDDLLLGASVQIDGREACDVSTKDSCAILVDTRQYPSGVSLQITQEGYQPIRKDVDLKGKSDSITVGLRFFPVYGVLRVDSLLPTGGKCSGDVFVDDDKVGSTPWSGKVLAKGHKVVVNCAGMAGTQNIQVEEKKTTDITISVQPYSYDDLRAAQNNLFLHRAIDWGLIALTGTTATIAVRNFSQGQQAYTDASSIQESYEVTEYNELLETGASHIRTSNVNMAVCASSIGVGVIHHLWLTRKSRKHLDDVEKIREASL